MPGPALRPYQTEAVEAIATGLADGGSGQLHAACSSGKSLMAMRAAERLVGPDGLVVVLAPTLSLVSQILDDWQEDSAVGFQRFAVCSDATVAADEDAPVFRASDFHVPVSTDRDIIGKWLAAEGPRLIVGTYLSALRLAAAVRDAGIEIDMLICDEAHHLAGNADAHTRRIMDPAVLPTRRRLYMTGTPRIGNGRDDEQHDTRTLSMDDETAFGPVFYTYAFSRGIEEGYLADYRIAVIGVTDREVRDLLSREDIEYADGIGLNTAAAQVALARAFRDFGLRRAITFHATIDDAQRFAVTLPGTLATLPDAEGIPAPTCLHVNGGMDGEQRRAALDGLKNPPKGGWSVVSNVHCLSEGVDVPALDGVLFGNPKRSTVDIVQAASRALRPHPDTPGLSTIIVPVIVPGEGDEVESIDPGAYEALFQILRALKEHDDVLSSELNNARARVRPPQPPVDPPGPTICGDPDEGPFGTPTIEPGGSGAGAPDPIGEPDHRLSKVEFHGFSPKFLAEMRLVVLRRTTSEWWEQFTAACRFHEAHGHLEVPRHLEFAGFRLGQCISTWRQMERRGRLTQERKQLLDELGMIWNAPDEWWGRGIRAAMAFHEERGNLRVTRTEEVDDFPLGQWISTQREERRIGRLDSDRARCLDDLGMIWNVIDDAWEQGYRAAKTYKDYQGDLRVPGRHVTPDGFPLGSWIIKQRTKRRRGRLAPERAARLDDLEMIWSPNDDDWDRGVRAAREFRRQQGHLLVRNQDIVDGFPLGRWLADRRRDWREAKLSTHRIRALTELGMVWVWSHADEHWRRGFELATAYAHEHGSLLVPARFAVDGYRLGAWICQQRTRRRVGDLSPERVQLLDEVGMVWDALEEEWRRGFQAAREYKEEHGHLLGPWKEASEGFNLAQWIAVQRRSWRRGKLEPERARLLDELGMVWTPMAGTHQRNAEHLAAVAEICAEASRAGKPQAAAVAQAFEVPVNTASGWMRVARNKSSGVI